MLILSKASALDPPPWHYGGDVLAIVFEAEEAEIKKLLSPPLEPGPNPRLATRPQKINRIAVPFLFN